MNKAGSLLSSLSSLSTPITDASHFAEWTSFHQYFTPGEQYIIKHVVEKAQVIVSSVQPLSPPSAPVAVTDSSPSLTVRLEPQEGGHRPHGSWSHRRRKVDLVARC